MNAPSLFRLPIFWLFMGPPIVRLSERASMASLGGSYDFWNFFQTAWWVFWGGVALRELYRNRQWLRRLWHDAGSLPLWTGLWLFVSGLSSIVSPAPLFSLAKVVLLASLALTAADLGVKVYAGAVSVRRILKILLVISVTLLTLVGVLFFAVPQLVVDHHGVLQSGFDIRTRGGRIGYTPVLSIVTFCLGLYFFLTARGGARWLHIAIMAMGLLFMALAQTRSAYGGFAAGMALFAWRWTQMGRSVVSFMTGAALAVVTFCLLLLSYSWSGSAAQTYSATFEFVVRDTESLSTMTGRTQVMEILWQEMAGQPLGLGFSAGPRAVLQQDKYVRALQSEAFGNAHNAYLEVLAGSGYFGFVAWMAIVLCVLNIARKMQHRDLAPMLALLAAVLLEGVTESLLVMPFYQTSVLFWVVVGVAVAHRARKVPEIPASSSHAPAYAL